ncbi:ATP-binding protein [Desulfuromonas sp. TF]|uniref:ATP-binding protein n=1 Tax=Desulfuromonas sp. TF TaxID=1232410 RepID=UPI00138ADB7A|nr:ATP-binding protein [Desulfuromonas sp. TF]
MGFFSYSRQVNQLEESVKDLAKNQYRLFQSILEADAEGLARAQTGLTRLEPLLIPFAGKDRARLLAATNPVFEELKRNHSITHMYFVEPDGTVFLRAHAPEQHGDSLTRATYFKAAESRKTVTGLEMGRNFFSLRCVEPLFHQGELIGYMEVAEEIDHVFERMKAITGNDVSLFLTQAFLQSYQMDFQTKQVDGFTVLYPTDREVSQQLAANSIELMREGLEKFSVSIVELNGKKYAVGMGPFQDAFGATGGILFSQRDLTPLYSAMWKGIMTSITVFSAIFFVCSALFYLSLRKSVKLFDVLRRHIQAVTKTWDLSCPLESNTCDEIGELVADFNLMKEEIRKLKGNLELRAEELAAANRELEAFSSSVSHDLRRPLTRIYTAAQLLQDGYSENLDSTGDFLVQEICRASAGMEELIEDLLMLSRIGRSEMQREKVDISLLAREVADEVQLIQPERRVEWVIPSGFAVRGDGHLLKVALRNLLENAWKFTGPVQHPKIEIGMIDQQERKAIFVRDNGVGFDMKDADRLFQPFQRLHDSNEFPGTGIGLATVQRIVHRHGGTLWVKGEKGKGTTFFFSLP